VVAYPAASKVCCCRGAWGLKLSNSQRTRIFAKLTKNVPFEASSTDMTFDKENSTFNLGLGICLDEIVVCYGQIVA
jgi:hypothetical protein